jgi:GNAT superfamily N-acetyltransferase
LEIIPVTDLNSQDFREAAQIYLKSFPANETRPMKMIKSLLTQGNYKLFVVKENIVVGIALVYFFDDFGLFDYLAIKPEYQRKGIGTKLYLYVCDVSKNKNHGFLFFEVQRENSVEPNRKDRLKLFKSVGAKLVVDTYMMPSYGSEPEQMNLLVVPQKNQNSILKQDLQIYLKKIYHDVYGPEYLDLLEKTSKTLPEEIILREIKIN